MSDSVKNQSLQKILAFYLEKYPYPNVKYDLFEWITIAFLKENNEELTTLCVNNETREELFQFCHELIQSKDPEISEIIKKYS